MVGRAGTSRSGFTLLEMMAGMAILALAIGAAAAFTMAMADAWDASETSQLVRSSSLQGTNRMQQIIKEARYVGWGGVYSDGTGSAVFLWKEDRPDSGKGTMQLSEIALLEYSATDQRVRLLQVDPNTLAGQKTADLDDIDEMGDVTAFKGLPGLVEKVIMRDVKSGRFQARHNEPDEQDILPSVEFVIRTSRTGESRTDYQSATVRAPTSRPAKCHGSGCPCTTSDTTHCGSAKSCACPASASCQTSATSRCRS